MPASRNELMMDDLENQENIDPRAAKRFKSKGAEEEEVQSPLQRMLQRQICAGSYSNLSPITELSHNMRGTVLDSCGTPKSSTLRTYNSISSSYDSGNSLDDEYMAMFELEAFDQMPLSQLPGDLDTLIRGQLKTHAAVPATTAEPRSARRCLSMTAHESPLEITPIRATHRTHKSKADTSSQQAEAKSSLSLVRKSVSMNNVDILNALGDEPQLIGDLTKPCALPVLLTGVRHRDLKTISCETLARLMRGDFAELSGRYKIIDCRYPYEFDGGHIRGALNLYTRGQMKSTFPVATDTDGDAGAGADTEQRNIYVFHCEFSSERGPKLLRFLRSNDRSVHTHDYPTLSYPELYLLHNGYKEFFSRYADLCEPSNYVPMLAPAHNEEYRLCRAKTRSWQCGEGDDGDSGIASATDGSGPPTHPRLLSKSRSRLLYAE
ncbi:hypothetical protein KR093_003559 [Drosophila rubida]|uniref:protein-tyrosine-phosphatase n=1 Tax=Drosophila rubida TaxID=30044 RepID=A0AAD4K6N3_9MUSC|nr:hypothetical protein KR093_003559 [Drosophila rubida]